MRSIGDLEYSNYTIRKSNFFILKILILTRRFLCPNLKSVMNLMKSKKSYVIFITAKDVLHGQQQIYHVERIIRESGKPFSDESHIIYFNTSYIDNSPLGKLAEDFHALETSKMHSPILSKRVEVLKSFNANQKGDQEMNVLLEQYRQKALREGMEKGMEKGSLANKKAMKLMGLLAEEGRIEDIKKASSASNPINCITFCLAKFPFSIPFSIPSFRAFCLYCSKRTFIS